MRRTTTLPRPPDADRVSAGHHRALGEALRVAGYAPIVRGVHGVIVDTVDGPRTIAVRRYAAAGAVHRSRSGGRHVVSGDVWRLRLDCDCIRYPRRHTLAQPRRPRLEVTCAEIELPAIVAWAAEYICDARAVCPVAVDGPIQTYVWTRRAVAEYEPTAANRRAAVDA